MIVACFVGVSPSTGDILPLFGNVWVHEIAKFAIGEFELSIELERKWYFIIIPSMIALGTFLFSMDASALCENTNHPYWTLQSFVANKMAIHEAAFNLTQKSHTHTDTHTETRSHVPTTRKMKYLKISADLEKNCPLPIMNLWLIWKL